MPEFRRRVDMNRWQTPAFSELFSIDHLDIPDEMDMEATQRKLERHFAESGMPVGLTVDRTMPSYTCFLAQFDRSIDEQDFQNCASEIEGDEGWVLGFSPLTKSQFRLFLRTPKHQPLNWLHVVTRITFRKAATSTSFVAGVDMMQALRVIDWVALKHILVMGSGGTKSSLVRNLLITALMLNTPTEFRFALIGNGSDQYRLLRDVPHALGNRAHTQVDDGLRLLLGMQREVKRRHAILQRHDAPDIETGNILIEDVGGAPLPRIMLVIDTLNHVEWIKSQSDWIESLMTLIEKGADVGIHLIMTTDGLHLPHPFDEISELLPHRFVTRSATMGTAFLEDFDTIHPSLSRFIDCFYTNREEVQSIELPAISTDVLRTVINYWQDTRTTRFDSINLLNISNDDEDTMRQLVKDLMDEEIPSAPPIPQKPSLEALARAAEVLSEDEKDQTEAFHISDQFSTNGFKPVEDAGELDISIETIHRAQALATYLGWLGKGPLMDVLGLTVKESHAVIAILQARQILERGSNPTPHLHPSRRR